MTEQTLTRWGLSPLELHRKVSVNEASRITGMSLRTLRRLQAEGQLPHYKLGRAVRFRVGDLLEFCERHRQEAASA